MKFPKAKKMAKRTIDLVHLAAASVWLGGFIVLFALSLDGGASLGLTSADTQLTIEAFRRKFIVPCRKPRMNNAAHQALVIGPRHTRKSPAYST